MHLSRLNLRVRDPDKLVAFYVDRLGMTATIENGDVLLGYPSQTLRLRLIRSTSARDYQHSKLDAYWKIGITLPDIDMASEQLLTAGVEVSQPHQFGDIGYLCHLNDPAGFTIELLQHDFAGNRPQGVGRADKVLGGGAGIGQVTLRVTDIEAALTTYRDGLGMRVLSIQPVTDYGFTLYFLAFTDESPPVNNLESVSNREWLWKRPYPTLELQYVHTLDSVHTRPTDSEAGFEQLWVSADSGDQTLADDFSDPLHMVSVSYTQRMT